MLNVKLQETRVYQEAWAEGEQRGRQEGRQEGERSLLSLILTQKFGTLPDRTTEQINALTLEQLESLAVALLGFDTIADLENWLVQQRG